MAHAGRAEPDPFAAANVAPRDVLLAACVLRFVDLVISGAHGASEYFLIDFRTRCYAGEVCHGTHEDFTGLLR